MEAPAATTKSTDNTRTTHDDLTPLEQLASGIDLTSGVPIVVRPSRIVPRQCSSSSISCGGSSDDDGSTRYPFLTPLFSFSLSLRVLCLGGWGYHLYK